MIIISAGYSITEYFTLITTLTTPVITPTKAGLLFAGLEMFR